MSRRHIGHLCVAATFAIAVLHASASVAASDTSSNTTDTAAPKGLNDSDLAEIVVTGEKRDTRLIDTPVSVSVFDSAQIQQSGIVSPSDFIYQTPNVTFTSAVNPGDFFINIRGVSSIRSGEPAIAIIIDGVPVADSSEFNTALFGLEQIEVLKGPEGAYWGRDAAGGAIIITTKKPTEQFSGESLLSYGNDNYYNATASVSQALIPNALSARLSVSFHGSDGSYTNPVTDEKSQRYEEQSARLRLIYDQGGPFTADYTLTGIHGLGGSDAFVAKISATPLSPNGTIVGGYPITNVSPNSQLEVPFVSDVLGRYQRQIVSNALVLNYKLGFADLSSITAYHDTRNFEGGKNFPYGNPADPTTNFFGWQAVFGDKTQYASHLYTQWDEELRLTSSGTHFVDWQVGAQFVQNREDYIQQNTLNGALPTDLAEADLAGYGGYNALGQRTLVGGGNPRPFPLGITALNSAYPTTAYNDKELTGTNYSPFGNITLNLTDALKLRIAGRYDTEVRHVNDKTPDVPNPFIGGASYNNCVHLLGESAAQCYQGIGQTFHEFQPKVTLDYKILPETTVYASYGIGFKTGGFNAIGTRKEALLGYIGAYEALGQSPAVAAANANAAVYTQDFYNKEIDTTYELGGKANLFNHWTYISAAIFLTESSNAQYYDFDPIAFVESINSIDKVRTRGFEIDGTQKLLGNLSLFADFGYVDPKITKFNAAPQFVGNYVPQVSRATFDGGFQFAQPIVNDKSITARIDYAWTGATYYTIDNIAAYERTPFGLLNARIGYETDRWNLTLWGKNIMNQHYTTEVTAILEPYSTAVNYGQLLSWGVDFRMKF